MIFGIKLYYLLVFIYIKLFKYVYIYFVFQLFYPKLRRLCFLSEAESIFRANREGFFYSFFQFFESINKIIFSKFKTKKQGKSGFRILFFHLLDHYFFFIKSVIKNKKKNIPPPPPYVNLHGHCIIVQFTPFMKEMFLELK